MQIYRISSHPPLSCTIFLPVGDLLSKHQNRNVWLCRHIFYLFSISMFSLFSVQCADCPSFSCCLLLLVTWSQGGQVLCADVACHRSPSCPQLHTAHYCLVMHQLLLCWAFTTTMHTLLHLFAFVSCPPNSSVRLLNVQRSNVRYPSSWECPKRIWLKSKNKLGVDGLAHTMPPQSSFAFCRESSISSYFTP